MKIQITLRDIVLNDLTSKFGINPYALNEGANPDIMYEAEYDHEIDFSKVRSTK